MTIHKSYILVLGMCMMLASCALNVPYHHFENIPVEGWNKEDTIHFSIDTLKVEGRYTLSLELRTTELYPYRNLALMVEEEMSYTKTQKKTVRRFPVHFETATQEGEHTGIGMSQHDLSKVLTSMNLHHGDSIHVKVFHKMRRLVLPGITDVGIKLER